MTEEVCDDNNTITELKSLTEISLVSFCSDDCMTFSRSLVPSVGMGASLTMKSVTMGITKRDRMPYGSATCALCNADCTVNWRLPVVSVAMAHSTLKKFAMWQHRRRTRMSLRHATVPYAIAVVKVPLPVPVVFAETGSPTPKRNTMTVLMAMIPMAALMIQPLSLNQVIAVTANPIL